MMDDIFIGVCVVALMAIFGAAAQQVSMGAVDWLAIFSYMLAELVAVVLAMLFIHLWEKKEAP